MDLQELKISPSIDGELINFVKSRCAKSDIDVLRVYPMHLFFERQVTPEQQFGIFNAEEGHRAPPVCNQL